MSGTGGGARGLDGRVGRVGRSGGRCGGRGAGSSDCRPAEATALGWRTFLMRLTSAEPMRRLTPASTARGTSYVWSRSGRGRGWGRGCSTGHGSFLGRARSWVEARVGTRVEVRTGARAGLQRLGRVSSCAVAHSRDAAPVPLRGENRGQELGGEKSDEHILVLRLRLWLRRKGFGLGLGLGRVVFAVSVDTVL